MPILEIEPRKRTKVLWIGGAVPKTLAPILSVSQLSIEEYTSPNHPISEDTLAGAIGAVFIQSEDRPQDAVDALHTNARRLLDHGCLVFILVVPQGLRTVVAQLRTLRIPSIWPADPPVGATMRVFNGYTERSWEECGDPPMPHARVYPAAISPEMDAINLLTRYGPSELIATDPRLSTPETPEARSAIFTISGPAADNLKPWSRLLLRRSFHDCKELHLDHFTELGRSGANVYLAHADLKQWPGARKPIPIREHARLPFFVKLGPRHKIISEWQNYEERVRQQIAFHLAPRLINERCELGARHGIIVGEFVDESESLGECARAARATTPIGTLFDRTLRGWHRHATVQKASLLYTQLRPLLKEEVPEPRLRTARTVRPAKFSPNEFRLALQRRPSEDLLWGPIHGDLHTANVRIRGSDAILIDFLSTRDGPLLVDPAALEVSLAIRVPKNDSFDRTAWVRLLTCLLSKDYLHRPPPIPDPTLKYAWIASCIRQVRLHALPMQRKPGQYATVLAYYYYQAATKDRVLDRTKDPDANEDYRRSVAYTLADSLLNLTW